MEDRPDHHLLLTPPLPHGILAGTLAGSLGSDDARPFIGITLNKPRGEGTTIRLIDPETMFVIRVHLIAGGSVRIQSHGQQGNFYYTRLTIRGVHRQVYLSRLIVGTGPGLLTKASPDFHDLRRGSLGDLHRDNPEATLNRPAAKLGRDEAKQYTREAIREALALGETLPTSADSEQRIIELLDDGYRLLDRVPLGSKRSTAETFS